MLTKELILPNGAQDCHASTVIELSGGGFLAAWFQGSREGNPDTAIWIASRTAAGWQTPRAAAKITYEAHWNPVLFRLPDNRIALYFKVGALIAGWRTYVMYSGDDGEHWTAARELVPGDRSGGRGPVKNQPLRLSNGFLLAPSSTEQGNWTPQVDLSFSGGMFWERTVPIPVRSFQLKDHVSANCLGLIQPALWESEPGKVHMLLRSNNGRIFRSDSTDSGLSWGEAYSTDLPNNNSGLDLKKLPDGRLVLICNPFSSNWGNRHQIVARFSGDNGGSWSEPFELETTEPGEFEPGRAAEFSYPTVIAASGNRLAVTYTWHRKNIRFLEGTLEEFGVGKA